MPTRRSYGDACSIARALDVVGERWALLIVRELLFGPQRYSDLRQALPNASSNIVSDRLHELEDHGVIRRRRLPPPSGSWVYELSEWGGRLEPIVLALGEWALDVPLPPGPRAISATSALLFVRGVAQPDRRAAPATWRVELGEHVWTVELGPDGTRVSAGEPIAPDLLIRTDPVTLVELFEDPQRLDAAVAEESVSVTGDTSTLRRLLQTAT